ncbi:MAG: carboxypeptidase-like regulatory domain-containing protein [Bacteroidota bacterium]|nr:TonB-dependent receptor [Odoribacter sp.]MDP3643465.1 carboxypeptidase-like regulatory domain-containing protein [Bacteroidota bacterium]
MKRLIFAVLVALVSTSAIAEKSDSKAETKTEAAVFSLSGNVIDEVSGEALVGVEVKVEGSDVKTYTDFDGHFVFDNLKAGQCKLVSSYTSYNKNEKTFQVNSKASQVKIELQASK